MTSRRGFFAWVLSALCLLVFRGRVRGGADEFDSYRVGTMDGMTRSYTRRFWVRGVRGAARLPYLASTPSEAARHPATSRSGLPKFGEFYKTPGGSFDAAAFVCEMLARPLEGQGVDDWVVDVTYAKG